MAVKANHANQAVKAVDTAQTEKSTKGRKAKNTRNLKPDVVLKNYWNDNEHFADLFNAVLFGGQPVIRPQELTSLDTEESFLLVHRKYAKSIQASRDHIKIRKRSSNGIELVMLAKESQEHIHYAMPIRVMGYDYGTYKKQYDSNAGKYRPGKGNDLSSLTRDEYLSRMRQTDRFLPVITVVVYYGEAPWNGATTLHGLLDIPEEFARFVNDYKILLVEARQNNLIFHNNNNKDLFCLLEILLNSDLPALEARDQAIRYSEKHHTDPSVIMTLAGATNCNIDYSNFQKGEIPMIRVFQELAQEHEAIGEARGEAIGETKGRAAEIVETGYEFRLSEEDILDRLQKKLNISLQKAQEYLRMFGQPIL